MRPAILSLIVAACACAQTSIHDRLQELYREAPPEEQRDQIARIADYWKNVKAEDRQAHIDALREELSNLRNPPLLLFDGSARLLYMANSPEDARLAARAVPRASLPKVGVLSYFALVHGLARRNVDTSIAAFHILQWPETTLGIKPGLVFDVDEMLLDFLLPTDDTFWADEAIERLPLEENETAQKALLHLLWYAQTDFADRQMGAFANDASKPAGARAFAQELLARQPALSPSDRAEVLAATEEQLRERRRAGAAAAVFGDNRAREGYTYKILAKRRMSAEQ